MPAAPSTCSIRRGHEDFSEDTYRTLTAGRQRGHGDRRGEGPSRNRPASCFEVCRLRDVPIITFINKMDREGREPFRADRRDRAAAAARHRPPPVGRSAAGRNFLGCYDLRRDRLVVLIERGKSDGGLPIKLDDPALDAALPAEAAAQLRGKRRDGAGAVQAAGFSTPTAKVICPPLFLRQRRQ